MSKFGDLRYDLFAYEYVRSMDIERAAVDAGIPVEDGIRYLKSKKGRMRMDELTDGRRPGGEMLTQRIITELIRVGFGNIADVMDGDGGVMPRAKWPEHTLTIVAEYREGKQGVTVKGHNKLQALDMLLKIEGAYKQEVEGASNVTFINGGADVLAKIIGPMQAELQAPRESN